MVAASAGEAVVWQVGWEVKCLGTGGWRVLGSTRGGLSQALLVGSAVCVCACRIGQGDVVERRCSSGGCGVLFGSASDSRAEQVGVEGEYASRTRS